MQSGQSAIIIGCGFNWTGRGLADLGIDVTGIDTSSYILGNKDTSEEAEIRECLAEVGINPDTDVIHDTGLTRSRGVAGMNWLDYFMEGGRAAPANRGWGRLIGEDMSSNKSIRAVANTLSNTPAYVITEETLNSVDDATALKICESIDRFVAQKGNAQTQVIHILSPLQEEAFQQPDLNWKSYADWRTFLDANGFTTHKIIPSVTYGGVTAYGGLL